MVQVNVRRAKRARCWLLHHWGDWSTVDEVRPVRAIGPSLRHLSALSETRRRRQCQRCGVWDERVLHAEPASAAEITDHDHDVEIPRPRVTRAD
jgi:hypothetical protein